MPIKLNGSTSGYAQIQAAATAANNTLTLPSSGTNLLSDATLPTTTPTNGQIPIGNGTTYVPATITAGTGITVTNAAGSVTIAASGGGTVTSITAGTGLSGGTITTSGTISLVTTSGAIGTYGFFQYNGTGTIAPGSTTAGSNLKYAGIATGGTSGATLQNAVTAAATSPSGTWQSMGQVTTAIPVSGCLATAPYYSLFVRTA